MELCTLIKTYTRESTLSKGAAATLLESFLITAGSLGIFQD